MSSQREPGIGRLRLRLAAVAIVLVLLAMATGTSAAPLVVQKGRFGSGWWLESVSTPGDLVIIPGWSGPSEVAGIAVHLYDTSGNLLGGSLGLWNAGDIVDARATTSGQTVDIETVVPDESFPAQMNVRFRCSLAGACGNTNDFKVLVMIAGDQLSSSGFGIFADSATVGPAREGLDTAALTTRAFDGTAATVSVRDGSARTLAGVHVAQDATKTVHADDNLVAAFWTGSPTATMSVPSAVSGTCKPCIVPRAAPGDHVFHYDDVERSGREGFLVWADVPLT